MAKARIFETRKTTANVQKTALDRLLPVEMVPVSKLRPARSNAHQHSKEQLQGIANSIDRFGFLNFVVVDASGRIVAGHGRIAAAKLLGRRSVPVIRVSHLSETELRAFMLADNKLTEKAGWDRELLATELKELEVLLPELGLNLGITGFEPAEIDSLMIDFGDESPSSADEIPPALLRHLLEDVRQPVGVKPVPSHPSVQLAAPRVQIVFVRA